MYGTLHFIQTKSFKLILQKMNPDGNMNLDDFKDFLYGFYKDKSTNLAEHYFRAADKNKSGTINFTEFLMFLNHECTSNPEERLNWMFDLFDIDGNGTIERPEMINIYKVRPSVKFDAVHLHANFHSTFLYYL